MRIAHGGCADTVRDSALKVASGRKIHCGTWGIEPASVLRLYPLIYPAP